MLQRLTVSLLILAGMGAVGVSYAIISPPRIPQHVANDSGAIMGRVLDSEGQPVAGARVIAENPNVPLGLLPSADTDEEGKFLITDLAPGTYTVRAGKEEDGYPLTCFAFYSGGAGGAPQVTVDGHQITPEVMVRMDPKAASIVGSIIDATTNEPIKNGKIILRRVDNPDHFYLTGPNQRGTFKVLVPSVPFTIEVSAPGYEEWRSLNGGSNKQTAALQLTSGDTKELTIALRPVR